ncbi:MAG TPA: peroxiredoxin-like family protein [Chitinophagaceae bacterium]|jgi:peroxiredoxin|nr:peroxiredoxin-like family protein [Chitinophagaceae bacterium]
MKKLLLLSALVLTVQLAFSQEQPEGLFINSKAPDFKGKDQHGQEVRLKDQLKKGKVVLVFYRGHWCPYCNKQLQRLSDSLSLITEKGATVIAVTPEKPGKQDSTGNDKTINYSILYDEGLKIMKSYDVDFEVQENILTRYRNSGIDLEKINGNKDWKWLPVPAVYIIDKESNITYRYFNTDYKKRPTVAEIVKNLGPKENR